VPADRCSARFEADVAQRHPIFCGDLLRIVTYVLMRPRVWSSGGRRDEKCVAFRPGRCGARLEAGRSQRISRWCLQFTKRPRRPRSGAVDRALWGVNAGAMSPSRKLATR
jgi:hypothetical protein